MPRHTPETAPTAGLSPKKSELERLSKLRTSYLMESRSNPSNEALANSVGVAVVLQARMVDAINRLPKDADAITVMNAEYEALKITQ